MGAGRPGAAVRTTTLAFGPIGCGCCGAGAGGCGCGCCVTILDGEADDAEEDEDEDNAGEEEPGRTGDKLLDRGEHVAEETKGAGARAGGGAAAAAARAALSDTASVSSPNAANMRERGSSISGATNCMTGRERADMEGTST
jgi:hypothetical protein